MRAIRREGAVPELGELLQPDGVGVSLNALLLSVVRREGDPSLLTELGITLEGEPGSYRVECPEDLLPMVVAMVDLAGDSSTIGHLERRYPSGLRTSSWPTPSTFQGKGPMTRTY